jgi:hypothetical protein
MLIAAGHTVCYDIDTFAKSGVQLAPGLQILRSAACMFAALPILRS